ncbi:MAG: TRAP transporter small permease [Dorea sp.]
MNKFMDKLFKGIDYFTGILTGLMVVFVFLNVVLRTFFNSGLTWSEELSRYLFVYVTYIGAISAMRANGHLGVDTLISRMKPQVQMVMYVVSQALIAVIMGILIHGSYKMVIQNTASKTAALGIPYSVLYFAGIITGVSIAILAIANIAHAVTHPSEISEIVTMSTSDDDDVAAEAKEGAEDLSDEEYAKRLREKEEGGK